MLEVQPAWYISQMNGTSVPETNLKPEKFSHAKSHWNQKNKQAVLVQDTFVWGWTSMQWPSSTPAKMLSAQRQMKETQPALSLGLKLQYEWFDWTP